MVVLVLYLERLLLGDEIDSTVAFYWTVLMDQWAGEGSTFFKGAIISEQVLHWFSNVLEIRQTSAFK